MTPRVRVVAVQNTTGGRVVSNVTKLRVVSAKSKAALRKAGVVVTRKRQTHAEASEQRLFVKRWRMDPRTRDLPATSVPSGAHMSQLQATLMKADGLDRGVPDWMLFVPPTVLTSDGKVYIFNPQHFPIGLALEFKRATNKAGTAKPSATSDDQRRWHANLRQNGWRVETVTSAESAWAIVTDYLSLKAP